MGTGMATGKDQDEANEVKPENGWRKARLCSRVDLNLHFHGHSVVLPSNPLF